MIITILYNEDNGCDYHRLLLPSIFFDVQHGDVIKLIPHGLAGRDETVFQCDILFFSRVFHFDWGTLNKLREKYGFKIVIDIDDYHILPLNHLIYAGWEKNQVGLRILEACKNADYVLVTNELLLQHYKFYNKNIHVVPNALPFDIAPFISEKEESDKIRFMYTAGSTHYHDLKSIGGLFKRLASDGEFKNKGNFTLCGYNNPNNEPNNTWNKMESIVKIKNCYTRRHTLPLGYYIRHYNYGDVAIAPLENTIFNNGKSNLKFLEAACMKKPFICSNVLPYTQDSLGDIVFCNKTSDWFKAFKYFLNNPNAIEDIGNKNYEYAKEKYNLKEINKIRIQIFKQLI